MSRVDEQQRLRRCYRCSNDLPLTKFSKTQLRKKGSKAKCTSCTNNINQISNSQKLQVKRKKETSCSVSRLKPQHVTNSLAQDREESPTSVSDLPVVQDNQSQILNQRCLAKLFKLVSQDWNLDKAKAKQEFSRLLKQFEGKEEQLLHQIQNKRSQGLHSIPRQDLNQSKRKRSEANCDRCDGSHESHTCPYYKRPRGSHPDAQKGYHSGLATPGGEKYVPFSRAKVRHQPGDGSCLYHSMCYGLNNHISAFNLRRNLAKWVERNHAFKVAHTKLRDWVRWESGKNVSSYVAHIMRGGSWGGAIEMVACANLYKCNVHVYQASSKRQAYKRISCFNFGNTSRIVNVLYQGGIHYDALQLRK